MSLVERRTRDHDLPLANCSAEFDFAKSPFDQRRPLAGNDLLVRLVDRDDHSDGTGLGIHHLADACEAPFPFRPEVASNLPDDYVYGKQLANSLHVHNRQGRHDLG